jgi:subtilisin-like proprotein convertase family protein
MQNVATIAISAMIFGNVAVADTISKTTTFDSFLDNSSVYLDFMFETADFTMPASVSDVEVEVYFAKHDTAFVGGDQFIGRNVDLPNGEPRLSEIEFTLVSPSGVSVTLVNNEPGEESFDDGLDPFRGWITFSQGAANPVNYNNIPEEGTFRPASGQAVVQSLAAFNGEDPLGMWRLFVEDDVMGEPLSFYEATLSVSTTDSPAMVPLPASVIMLATGLGGVMLAGRRASAKRNR